jgi:hypothetical protein
MSGGLDENMFSQSAAHINSGCWLSCFGREVDIVESFDRGLK